MTMNVKKGFIEVSAAYYDLHTMRALFSFLSSESSLCFCVHELMLTT